MALGFLKNLFRAQPDIAKVADLRVGAVTVVGRVKAADASLRSPIKGVPCVAFHYRAFYFVQGRTGWLERSLKSVEVHAPAYVLELEDGNLPVAAPKGETFTNIDHREVAARGFQSFKAEEQVVRPGSRVQIRGKVARRGEALVLEPKQVRILAEPEKPGAALRSARPERRRDRRRK